MTRERWEQILFAHVPDEVVQDMLNAYVLEIEAENAKLRKLSSIMLKYIKANERKALICWECPVHKQFDELRSYCCLEHEAKELGIGVEP